MPHLRVEKNESTPPPIDFEKSFTGRPEGVQKKLPSSNYGGENERLSRMALRLLQEVLLLTTVPETDLKPVPSARDVKDFGLDPIHSDEESPSMWPSEFNRLQREIIELWEACNVSLVHRTSFSYLKVIRVIIFTWRLSTGDCPSSKIRLLGAQEIGKPTVE
ncbi:PREDICTED: kinesin [Prunus dulcis]|uniref:PREDICTED: kinesin n=1 Tax=Prunus dulcis TaxID=3755 RepID=A0A5E4GMI6_PRUDU|nr:PREDICTED: kinesin [Prunus dulcis]